MKARLLLKEKIVLEDGAVVELVLWELPEKTSDRLHGYKYRLYYGDVRGNCLVRYDNESGKGDHKHINGQELPYQFVDRETLITDFKQDISNYLNQGKKQR